LVPILRWAFPDFLLTTEQIGHAMISIARNGTPKQILEIKDIRALARP